MEVSSETSDIPIWKSLARLPIYAQLDVRMRVAGAGRVPDKPVVIVSEVSLETSI